MTRKLLALLLAALLMISAAGCGAKPEPADDAAAQRIAALEQENADLKAQVEELTAKLDRLSQKAALQNWTLDAKAWSDGNGATVTFNAWPISYAEGQKAALSVRMGELEAESTNCVWDGSVFTGSVELSAADGYSYFCILTSPDGTQSELELNAPENVSNETLVYLGSSLSAYASLMVEDWDAAEGSLNIKTGHVQCQMPRLTFTNVIPAVSAASLVLKLNDQEIGRTDLDLPAGEGEGSYELTLANQSFAIPTVENDSQLDLWLEVTLDNGSTLSVIGGSWYGADGALQMVVG